MSTETQTQRRERVFAHLLESSAGSVGRMTSEQTVAATANLIENLTMDGILDALMAVLDAGDRDELIESLTDMKGL